MGRPDDAEAQRSAAARTTASVLEGLDVIAAPLRQRLSEPMTLLEPAVVLDLGSRQGDRGRTVKHVHQMCALHSMQYVRATEMKAAHLVDAFELLASAGNALALYPIARSALELFAQVSDVSQRLMKAQESVSTTNWFPGGEEFFKVIVRARYATSNADHLAMLQADGVSKRTLDPMNVGKAIGLLDQDPTARHAHRRYSELCDAVHHNLSAHATITSGSGVDTAARNSNGGMMIGPPGQPATVTRYEYPVVWKADITVARIGPDFVEDVRSTLALLERFPESPYSPEVLLEFTGHPLGAQPVERRADGSPILPPARSTKQERNQPCSCGSGRKYKLCCGV